MAFLLNLKNECAVSSQTKTTSKNAPKEVSTKTATTTRDKATKKLWRYELKGGKIRLLEYKGNEQSVTIPAYIEETSVTVIAPGTFVGPHRRGTNQAVLGYFFAENAEETVPDSISKYMSKNFDTIVPAVQRIPELLERILSRDVLQIEQIELLLEKQNENVQHCAILLEYKNRRFSTEEVEKYMATKEKKQCKGPTAAELKKIWKPRALSDGSFEVGDYCGTDTYVVVPAMIGKKQVTKIGSCCFYVSPFNESNRKNITVIDIPEGVF